MNTMKLVCVISYIYALLLAYKITAILQSIMLLQCLIDTKIAWLVTKYCYPLVVMVQVMALHVALGPIQ